MRSHRRNTQTAKELMSSKAQKISPDLAELCKKYGFRMPIKAADNAFHEIAPGHLRKFYGRSHANEQLVLMAPALNLSEKLRPLPEIAAGRDMRTPEQLSKQVAEAITQLLRRAHCGDKEAVARVILSAIRAVEALEHLTKFQEEAVRAEAKGQPRWPVLLSLNPKEIKHVKEHLESLRVGLNARTQTWHGQKFDPRNFWTRLAVAAYTACVRCKIAVPELERPCSGIKGSRKSLKWWRTEVMATYYSLPSGKVVIIPDWQRACKRLPELTHDSFDDWWRVVRLCILQYWQNPMGNYREALEQIPDEQETDEARKRDRALARTKQAFRSAVGLLPA